MKGRQDRARTRVVAWGTSVLTSALVAGLAKRPQLEVVQVETSLAAGLDAVRSRPTHAVVCDLASVPADEILALLAAHPHLRVVIVLPNADRGLALRCARPLVRTIDDLVAALAEGELQEDVPVAASR